MKPLLILAIFAAVLLGIASPVHAQAPKWTFDPLSVQPAATYVEPHMMICDATGRSAFLMSFYKFNPSSGAFDFLHKSIISLSSSGKLLYSHSITGGSNQAVDLLRFSGGKLYALIDFASGRVVRKFQVSSGKLVTKDTALPTYGLIVHQDATTDPLGYFVSVTDPTFGLTRILRYSN